MVWAVQGACALSRADRHRAARRQGGQAQHRRGARDRGALRRALDPDRDPLRGRRAGADGGRPEAEVAAAARAGVVAASARAYRSKYDTNQRGEGGDGEDAEDQRERADAERDREPGHAASVRAAQRVASARPALRLRPCAVWCLLGVGGRQGDPFVRHAGCAVCGQEGDDVEGLPALYAQQKSSAKAPALHPLQQAWIDEQVPHCGYCQSGMMITAADLLARTQAPTEAQIRRS